MIKYCIVEDEPEIRRNIEMCLTADTQYQCVASVESIEQLFHILHGEDLPDLVLMDINLPGMSGIDGTRILKDRFETIEVVMLTNYDDCQRVFESLRAGAGGYLLKSTSFDDILDALKLLSAGGAPMTPQIARKTLEFFRPPKKKNTPKSPLTEKEKEVVQALVDGLSYKLIAARLNISIGTVYTHIKNIYRKLHVNSKAEVISQTLKQRS